MIFKYVLIVLLGLFCVYVLAMPRTAMLRKGFVLSIVAVMLMFVIKPEWSTAIAELVGIARGTDLLFYLSNLLLFFIAFMYYLKFKEIEARFAKLVRQLALDTAARENATQRRSP